MTMIMTIHLLFCFVFIINSIVLCRLNCKHWPCSTLLQDPSSWQGLAGSNKKWTKTMKNASCIQTALWVWITKEQIIWSFSFRFKILSINKTSGPDTRLIYFPVTRARKNIIEDYTFQILDMFLVAKFLFSNKSSLTEHYLKDLWRM